MKIRKPAAKSFKEKARPQALRLSPEAQSRFRQRQSGSAQEARDQGRGRPGPAGGLRADRYQKEKPENIHLYLSPGLMELADELAQELHMPFKIYIAELLKYALLAHGKRLGHKQKYVSEFKSANARKVSSWRPGENTFAGNKQETSFQRRPQSSGIAGKSNSSYSSGNFKRQDRRERKDADKKSPFQKGRFRTKDNSKPRAAASKWQFNSSKGQPASN